MLWQNCSLMPLEMVIRDGAGEDMTALNTFGVPVRAGKVIEIDSEETLQEARSEERGPFFVLGGGSNVLFTRDVDGVVLKNEIAGMEVIENDGCTAVVKIGGGESWHRFVLWALERGLGGVENLSLIPGTVGAAPIQNIGAYGVELQDVFERLTAMRLTDGVPDSFARADCAFGYRDSIFKHRCQGQYFITHVYLRLTVKDHQLSLDYGDIRNTLSGWDIEHPTIADVSQAVIHIRRQKLPDPHQLGNAGSFFKNPVVTASDFAEIKSKFPEIMHYRLAGDLVKIPAAWLIERAGWKGKRVGRVGCYEKQALIIVNYGGATGAEIWRHAQRVIESVWDRFGIVLQPEVGVY